ncbi:hypothetical protein FRC05_007010 [Tulasnella sp. 425]|nr:hypothetical protein FRC05_007010 [Tulasnella sp. 425]
MSVNGVLAFCFYTLTSPHIINSESATAFIGGTLFWIGGYLSYVESLNPAAHAHFGWEVDHEARRLVEPRAPGTPGALGRGRRHFGRHRVGAGGLVEEEDVEGGKPGGGVANGKQGGQAPPKWRWVGADWSSFGWLSVLCGLPGILPDAGSGPSEGLPAKDVGLWEGLYWVPQIMGSPGFIISGAMFSLEVQKKWYKPELLSLGWHV